MGTKIRNDLSELPNTLVTVSANAGRFLKEHDVPRSQPVVHIDVIKSAAEPTEAEMRVWVRMTEILLRIKARRDARLAEERDRDTHFLQDQDK